MAVAAFPYHKKHTCLSNFWQNQPAQHLCCKPHFLTLCQQFFERPISALMAGNLASIQARHITILVNILLDCVSIAGLSRVGCEETGGSKDLLELKINKRE
ncbi:MAG: hypothetical protein ABJQ21_00850, partial [Roseibium sp.]